MYITNLTYSLISGSSRDARSSWTQFRRCLAYRWLSFKSPILKFWKIPLGIGTVVIFLRYWKITVNHRLNDLFISNIKLWFLDLIVLIKCGFSSFIFPFSSLSLGEHSADIYFRMCFIGFGNWVSSFCSGFESILNNGLKLWAESQLGFFIVSFYTISISK